MNDTHDPALRSWVASANAEGSPFPIQNLPYGVFLKGDEGQAIGVAIGDQILDVAAAVKAGLLTGAGAEACREGTLNRLMGLGKSDRVELRRQISGLLSEAGKPEDSVAETLLVSQAGATMTVPAQIGDYTDFYASIHHATNVGSLFRPDNPLLPNYRWIPIGYHGRSSSIVVSGTPVVRPSGQKRPGGEGEAPGYGPSGALDYELEIGAFVGPGNDLGDTIPLDQAEDHLFGVCLLNDWSARDVQGWEYQPLGPFLGKSFASTISPWIVTAEALEPFRIPAFERPEGDPDPLPYLNNPADRTQGGISMDLEVLLLTETMRENGDEPVRLSRGDFSGLYWTLAQMITHHSSNGCNLQPGDMIGSGTVSGPEKDSRGCLLELTWRGAEPITLPNGETRAFLKDGDEVILRGACHAEGRISIGLGECRGVVLPAR